MPESDDDSIPLFNKNYDLRYVYQNDKELKDLDMSINIYSSDTNIKYYDENDIIDTTEIKLNSTNYPITILYNDIVPNKTNYSSSVSNLNSNFINQLNVDYLKNNEIMANYTDKQKILNQLKIKNHTLDANYTESLQQPFYIFFIIWCFIFVFLIFTLMLNLIEDVSHINLFTKLLLFVVFIYILFKSYKNIMIYFNN